MIVLNVPIIKHCTALCEFLRSFMMALAHLPTRCGFDIYCCVGDCGIMANYSSI